MPITVYFEHGRVVKLFPEPNQSYYDVRDKINAATDIVSDGIKYDLTDKQSIYSIAIPDYTKVRNVPPSKELGPTGYLEYVLRMHAGFLWNDGDYQLSMACLEKSCQLMTYSTLGWERKDFYRVVNYYIELGRFKKAKEWKDWIDAHTESPEDYAKDAFARTLESCRKLGTDLIEVGDSSACCEICAKYRRRIYSLSGKSWKFPKFPDDFHFQCGLGIFAYIDGVSEPSFKCISPSLYSKRPFRDDRTEEEKENYRLWLARVEEYYNPINEPNLNHIIYYWFKPKFPDDFPKSLSGFSRMRNGNTANYQKLAQKIEDAGYTIPKSLDEVAEWEEREN